MISWLLEYFYSFLSKLFGFIITIIYGQKKDYWKSKGYEQVDIFKAKPGSKEVDPRNFIDIFTACYQYADKPYIFSYQFPATPTIFVFSPSLIEKVLVKDFKYFVNHFNSDLTGNSKVDSGLFFLIDDVWRAVRHKIVPTFTTGKLRNMFEEMSKCTEKSIEFIDNTEDGEVEVKEAVISYSLAIISNCVFGIELSSDKDSEFRKQSNNLFRIDGLRGLQFAILINSPKFAKLLGISFTPKKAAKYYSDLIIETFEYREKHNVVRNDYVQLLLQLKQKGSIPIQTKDKEDDYLSQISEDAVKNVEITENILISQALQFLLSGLDNLSVSVVFALFELSQNKELQGRVREEIEQLKKKHNGFSFDMLREATLVSNCINESLRLYPLSPQLTRMSTSPYMWEEGKMIDKDISIVIPVFNIHRDPKFFKDPLKFNPDRFVTDTIAPFTYLPFGDGPRMCIAMRFALLTIKLIFATIVYHYEVDMSEKTKLPLEFDKSSFILTPSSPVWLKMKKIKRDLNEN